VAGLAGADLAWEFAADNFSVIREPEGEAGKVLFRINL
jgi:hypothetical protein